MLSAQLAAQIRAARRLLGWSQDELAAKASLAKATINRAETGEMPVATMDVIRRTLDAAGVIFVEENGEGPGVRLKKKRR